jgi:hypothetical protein
MNTFFFLFFSFASIFFGLFGWRIDGPASSNHKQGAPAHLSHFTLTLKVSNSFVCDPTAKFITASVKML